MKLYELVKYRYGLKPKVYTAFCLTPAIRPPTVRIIAGKELTFSNKGPSSEEARHFQRRSTAEAWVAMAGVTIVDPDWSLIPNTVEFGRPGG